MKKISAFLFTCMLTIYAYAVQPQKYFSYFSTAAIQEANTAAWASISPEEKEVVLWTNLARLEPQNFYKMLIAYVPAQQRLSLSNSYVQSLLMDLKNASPLPALKVATLLNQNATSHAIYSQKTKRMGHENFDKRAQLAFSKDYKSYGENCVYGITNALDAVVSLLIDEGVPDLGHRKIILSNQFNEIGVAMTEFYSNNSKVVVQQFGNQLKTQLNESVDLSTSVAIQTPKEPIVNTSTMPSTLKRMYINGKYVWVDTAKYYTPGEYKRYVQQAQKLKSQQ